MAGELEICVQELNSGKETYMMLPWSMGEIYDDLDRCKIFDEYAVYITESNDIPELMDCRFTIPPTPPLVLGISSPIAIQWEFPITFEMAQAYQKARGKWIQKRNWHDMTMVINIEIGA